MPGTCYKEDAERSKSPTSRWLITWQALYMQVPGHTPQEMGTRHQPILQMGTLRPQAQKGVTARMCQIWGSKPALPHPKVYASIHCMMLVCGGLVRREESGVVRGWQPFSLFREWRLLFSGSPCALQMSRRSAPRTQASRSWPTKP